jgi:hypothetical protein
MRIVFGIEWRCLWLGLFQPVNESLVLDRLWTLAWRSLDAVGWRLLEQMVQYATYVFQDFNEIHVCIVYRHRLGVSCRGKQIRKGLVLAV